MQGRSLANPRHALCLKRVQSIAHATQRCVTKQSDPLSSHKQLKCHVQHSPSCFTSTVMEHLSIFRWLSIRVDLRWMRLGLLLGAMAVSVFAMAFVRGDRLG